MGFVVAVLALGLALIFAFPASAVDCTIESICRQYDAFTGVPVESRLVNKRTLKGEKSTGDQHTRGVWLFAEAKTRLKKVLLKGRSENQLAPEEVAVWNAITNVDLVENSHPECVKSCPIRQSPFAFPFQNSKGGGPRVGVCRCTRADQYADEVLFTVFGHEIMHAGDICAFQRTGLNPGEHPLEKANAGPSVLQCLQSNGFKMGQFGSGMLDNLKAYDPEGYQYGRQYPPCYARLTGGNMQEASADILTYEALGDLLKEYPLEKGDGKNIRRVFGYLAELACREHSIAIYKGPGYQGHPPPGLRITHAALAIPSIREALGCESYRQVQNCDYKPPGTKSTGKTTRTRSSATK